jgi:hypothetical protein
MATKYFCDKCSREKEVAIIRILRGDATLGTQEYCKDCIEQLVREFKDKLPVIRKRPVE